MAEHRQAEGIHFQEVDREAGAASMEDPPIATPGRQDPGIPDAEPFGPEHGFLESSRPTPNEEPCPAPRVQTGMVRTSGFTAMGGLLFLVGVLDDLGVPDALARDALFCMRSLRWLLHRLALRLVPVQARDPAALAFAGLGPHAAPPAEDTPLSPQESDALDALAASIGGTLRERLYWEDLPQAELLDRVCRRRAQVVADPGWIEVRLALDEVTTDVRRAALDLDPGYVPWLGVVLKFLYT